MIKYLQISTLVLLVFYVLGCSVNKRGSQNHFKLFEKRQHLKGVHFKGFKKAKNSKKLIPQSKHSEEDIPNDSCKVENPIIGDKPQSKKGKPIFPKLILTPHGKVKPKKNEWFVRSRNKVASIPNLREGSSEEELKAKSEKLKKIGIVLVIAGVLLYLLMGTIFPFWALVVTFFVAMGLVVFGIVLLRKSKKIRRLLSPEQEESEYVPESEPQKPTKTYTENQILLNTIGCWFFGIAGALALLSAVISFFAVISIPNLTLGAFFFYSLMLTLLGSFTALLIMIFLALLQIRKNMKKQNAMLK
jgi:hypothetical protein